MHGSFNCYLQSRLKLRFGSDGVSTIPLCPHITGKHKSKEEFCSQIMINMNMFESSTLTARNYNEFQLTLQSATKGIDCLCKICTLIFLSEISQSLDVIHLSSLSTIFIYPNFIKSIYKYTDIWTIPVQTISFALLKIRLDHTMNDTQYIIDNE